MRAVNRILSLASYFSLQRVTVTERSPNSTTQRTGEFYSRYSQDQRAVSIEVHMNRSVTSVFTNCLLAAGLFPVASQGLKGSWSANKSQVVFSCRGFRLSGRLSFEFPIVVYITNL